MNSVKQLCWWLHFAFCRVKIFYPVSLWWMLSWKKNKKTQTEEKEKLLCSKHWKYQHLKQKLYVFLSFSRVFRLLDRTFWPAPASSFLTLCLTTSCNQAHDVVTNCRAEHPVVLECWQAAGQTDLHILGAKGASSTSCRQCQRGFKTSINLLAFLSLNSSVPALLVWMGLKAAKEVTMPICGSSEGLWNQA